ncbi:hypothetical protein EJ05DRAFT_486320 [Pseudovirgaria hyperparasitica]|uniref:Uncharacterized protein n=1 Tax=Pseudovirgaria hyperparasitica TaxID=470096 RepID=A0A6A6W8Q3_9PEZI|nr:uncharacterized protein EJ05DRAFT_486320 [Pseudovirgaria hyperparasitica]KAF2758276.1 hypothetical protein EJ05DRAFT_486320 [Pseudovirgaria hyperparasitica]
MADQLRRLVKNPTRNKHPTQPQDGDKVSDSGSSFSPAFSPLPAPPRVRPTFGSRLSSMLGSKNDSAPNNSFAEDLNFSFSPPVDEFARIDPMDLIEDIMSILFTEISKPLSPKYNGSLFKIFESFRNMKVENDKFKALIAELQTQLKESNRLRQVAENQYAEEEDGFKREIKRLELIICNGPQAGGISGVMHARQNSVIDRTRKHRYLALEAETLPFGEDDSCDSSQDRKGRQTSVRGSHASVAGEVELSRRFSTFRAPADPTFIVGTLPTYKSTNPLVELDQVHLLEKAVNKADDDGFSSDGDLLPDEIAERNLDMTPQQAQLAEKLAISELASLIARRKDLPVDQIISTMLEFLENGVLGSENGNADVAKTFRGSGGRYDNRSTSSFQTQRSRPFSFIAGDDDNGLHARPHRVSGPGWLVPNARRTPTISEHPGPVQEETIEAPSLSPGRPLLISEKSKMPSPAGTSHTSSRRASPGSSPAQTSSSMNSFSRQESYQSSIKSTVTTMRHGSTNESRRSSNSGHSDLSYTRLPEKRANLTGNAAALAAARAAGRSSSGGANGKHKDKHGENQQPPRSEQPRHKHRSSITSIKAGDSMGKYDYEREEVDLDSYLMLPDCDATFATAASNIRSRQGVRVPERRKKDNDERSTLLPRPRPVDVKSERPEWMDR